MAIHFSPITNLLSILFTLGGEWVVVLVYATVAAFGLVWLSRSFDRTVPGWPHAMVVVVLALPLMLFVTFDLRLYTLLLSLVLVLALAIHHHRPGWIVAGLVVVLFATREESYYFSMVAACHLIATGRSRLGIPIAAGALLYGALLYRHFLALGGFTFELDRGVVLFLTAPVVLLALNPVNPDAKRLVIVQSTDHVIDPFSSDARTFVVPQRRPAAAREVDAERPDLVVDHARADRKELGGVVACAGSRAGLQSSTPADPARSSAERQGRNRLPVA